MKTVAILTLLTLIGCGSVDAARVSDAGMGGKGGAAGDPPGDGGVGGGTISDAGAGGAGGMAVDASPDVVLPPNLVTGSADAGAWSFTPPADGTATTDTMNGGYCATLTNSSTAVATIGWPAMIAQSISLPVGTMFQFSYRASTTMPLWTFFSKVGGSITDSTDFQAYDVPTSVPQTFTHAFTSNGDSAAGIAFVFSTDAVGPVTVCISDVALRVL